MKRYKERFENLFRIALKITSSLEIGDILESIRDEAKSSMPHVKEACLLMLDQDASKYARPLHCAVFENRLNCQVCKRNRKTVQDSMADPSKREWVFKNSQSLQKKTSPDEIAFSIYDGDNPLAVLVLISKEKHGFDMTKVDFLRDLIQLAANTIVNARKHRKMLEEKLSLDHILGHLRPFVPKTVQTIVEKNPEAPSFKKRDVDVSILFLDVGGYTSISENLSREKVDFIIEKYFSSFLDIIYCLDGDINETAGDGLMAIFQGDSATNALNSARASLAIRVQTQKINKELKGCFDPIAVNMGINSGIAALGMSRFRGIAGTRMTFTASGSVTNLAARIAASAKEGDILIGPETASRVKGEVSLFDLGERSFKNVKETIRVHSLVRQGK